MLWADAMENVIQASNPAYTRDGHEEWQREFERSAPKGQRIARVIRADRLGYHLSNGQKEMVARMPGRVRRQLKRDALPTVGDWVSYRTPADQTFMMVEQVLERRSLIVRRAAGTSEETQLIAANVDTVFVLIGLDGDYNTSRLGRYIALLAPTGCKIVLLLNKSDLENSSEDILGEIKAHHPKIKTHIVSALTGDGLDVLKTWLRPGRTIAMLGSSGTGKSTLGNALLGEDRLKVGEVRETDAKGRHTTTHRELYPLPSGTLLIDTPGLRELALAPDSQSLEEAFNDIFTLADECRFTNCLHQSEPGCAVQDALQKGELEEERFEEFLKLRDEQQEREDDAYFSSESTAGSRNVIRYKELLKDAINEEIAGKDE